MIELTHTKQFSDPINYSIGSYSPSASFNIPVASLPDCKVAQCGKVVTVASVVKCFLYSSPHLLKGLEVKLSTFAFAWE